MPGRSGLFRAPEFFSRLDGRRCYTWHMRWFLQGSRSFVLWLLLIFSTPINLVDLSKLAFAEKAGLHRYNKGQCDPYALERLGA